MVSYDSRLNEDNSNTSWLLGRMTRRKLLGRRPNSVTTLKRPHLYGCATMLILIVLGCYNYILLKTLRIRQETNNAERTSTRDSFSAQQRSMPAAQPASQRTSTTTAAQIVETSTAPKNYYSILSEIHNPPRSQSTRMPKATIAYLTSITGCPSSERENFIDAAAVLKHSIHQASIRNPHSGSVYDYAMYAIIHTQAAACQEAFANLGYHVMIRDTPFDMANVRNEKYVKRLTNPHAGCCQEKEFLKLYSYTMHDYAVVVHLDMDFIVLKPMDVLLDAFFLPDSETKMVPDAMFTADRTWKGRIETMFTRDYPMARPGREPAKVGMQGGFWIVRPNQTAFDELIGLIKQGNFEGGWYDGHVHYPGFYGAAMIQGLIGFYYGHYHPGQVLELDRCVHNQMADAPSSKDVCFAPLVDGECRDCRTENVSDIYSAHFTFCQKPWKCIRENYFVRDKLKGSLCMKLHKEWHRIRYDLEQQLGLAESVEPDDVYFGHCKKRRYSSIKFEP